MIFPVSPCEKWYHWHNRDLQIRTQSRFRLPTKGWLIKFVTSTDFVKVFVLLSLRKHPVLLPFSQTLHWAEHFGRSRVIWVSVFRNPTRFEQNFTKDIFYICHYNAKRPTQIKNWVTWRKYQKIYNWAVSKIIFSSCITSQMSHHFK